VCLEQLSGADVVTCFRIARQDPWYRTFNALLFRLVVQVLFGLKIQDPDCAYKIYRKHVVDAIDMTSRGALIDVEMLLQAHRAGFRIVQMGVHHLPRKHGESSGADLRVIFRACIEIMKLWFRYLRWPPASQR